MFKRWRWLYAACAGIILLALVLVLLQVARHSGTDDTWEHIQTSRILRIGIDATYPPFESGNADGTLSGYDIDLAHALADAWQLQVQFVQIHFDGLYAALEAGKCDLVLSALPYDRTMTQDVLYSQAYLQLGQVLVVTSPNHGIVSWHDLENHQVAVELGSEAHQLVRQLARDNGQTINILAEREPQLALEDLLNGQAQALVVDRLTALSYLRQYPQLSLVAELQNEIPLVIAVNKDASYTLARINQALDEFAGNGSLQAFEKRWFS
ncbi:MAG: substrate-binding periplasmic protein [Anaerolineae bacterium]